MASLRYWDLLEKTICPEDRGLQKKLRDLQRDNTAMRVIIKDIESDYNILKRLLRYKYPDIWKEYLNMDIPQIQKLETPNKETPCST